MQKRILFTAKPTLKVSRQAFIASQQDGAAGGSDKTTLTGYAILWNQLSDDRGGFFVRFLPGSVHFADPTMAIFHHDFRYVLGNTQNGSLRLLPDDTGVKVEIDLPATTQAADVATLVDGGYVGGMSFSMLYDDTLVTTTKTENGLEILEVSAFTCDEVTVTAIPSFSATSISVKSDAADSGDTEDSTPQQLTRYAREAPERAAQAIKLQQLQLNAYTL